jgi:hypothetical protein
MRTLALRSLLVLVLAGGPALAITASSGGLYVGDMPNTDQEWQEGWVVINAPPEKVRHWLTAYEEWRQIFPDIEWVQRMASDKQRRDVVRFRSKYAGRVITMHQSITPQLLVFEGWGPNVHTQGRTYVIDLGGGKTKVIMQTTAEVHGFIGVFATKGLKRSAALKAIRGHLSALLDAAAAR